MGTLQQRGGNLQTNLQISDFADHIGVIDNALQVTERPWLSVLTQVIEGVLQAFARLTKVFGGDLQLCGNSGMRHGRTP